MTAGELQAHINKLIRIKTQVYWYSNDKWDEIHERHYILLDVKNITDYSFVDDAVTLTPSLNPSSDIDNIVLQLLVDGSAKFVLTNQKDFEVIDDVF